jgi:DNA invertase Pin-like site-specific DNA recombinase
MKYGYARVSTDGQSVAAQVEELAVAGAEQIFGEKCSGAVSNHPQLKRVINAVGEGDMLLVTRLDRLARSTRDLLNTLAMHGRIPRRRTAD